MTQTQDITSPMTRPEKRATASLATIYALRMFGLFMLLPVLSLASEQMAGATPLLVGLAISIYGLTQAVLQIPFGLLSDRYGRKPIIIAGLLLFCIGSIVAATASSIYGVLLGRAIQGSGAIAATVMALLADLTQEVHRTKAMATIGISIGISFAVSLVLGPVVGVFIGVAGIFWLTAVLSLLAMALLLITVPTPSKSTVHKDAQAIPAKFSTVFKMPQLLRLNYGIFVLHLCLTASFVVLPLLIRDAGLPAADHWQIYLPVLLSSMLAIIPLVIYGEKKRQLKKVFLAAIAAIFVASIGLFVFTDNLTGIIGFLWLFFCGFNLLESTLPSLISKTAPGDLKGTAMGAYSSCQFMGAFIGGITGGWLYGEMGVAAVFLCNGIIAASWFLVARFMQTPRYLANMLINLDAIPHSGEKYATKELLAITGVETVTLDFAEKVGYLKVDSRRLQKQDLQDLLNRLEATRPAIPL